MDVLAVYHSGANPRAAIVSHTHHPATGSGFDRLRRGVFLLVSTFANAPMHADGSRYMTRSAILPLGDRKGTTFISDIFLFCPASVVALREVPEDQTQLHKRNMPLFF